MKPDSASPTETAQPEAAPPGSPNPIDIEALADRVYRLMCRELSLDRARGAQPTVE